MRIGRVSMAATAVAVALFCAAVAIAVPRPGLDPSYGENGTLAIEPPPPDGYQSTYLERVAVAPGGAAYALAAASPCAYPCAGSALYLYRYLPSGVLDRSFGAAGAARLPEDALNLRLGVDGRGRPLLVGPVKNGVQVFRYATSGRLDRGFGRDGSVSLRGREGFVRAVLAPRGRVLVVEDALIGSRGGEFEPAQARAHRVRLVRLLPSGRLDSGFGHGGALRVDLPGGFDTGISFTRKGAMLIGGSGCCGDPITVTRITAGGVLDTRFNAIAERSLTRLAGVGGKGIWDESTLGAVVPRSRGGLDLLGGDGQGAGFELRLRGDGRVATGFGSGGLRMLPKPVTAAVAGTGGAAFAISNVGGGLAAMRLLPNGRPDPAFGGGQPVPIPVPGASYGGTVTHVSRGRAMVVAEGQHECRGSCPPEMTLTRFIEPAGAAGGGRRQR